MADTFDIFARALVAALDCDPALRPRPTELVALAGSLRAIAAGLAAGEPVVSRPYPGPSVWVRETVSWAAGITAGSGPAKARERLLGLADGLDAAVVYVAGIERELLAAEAPTWDEFFVQDLGQPDLRIIEGKVDNDV